MYLLMRFTEIASTPAKSAHHVTCSPANNFQMKGGKDNVKLSSLRYAAPISLPNQRNIFMSLDEGLGT